MFFRFRFLAYVVMLIRLFRRSRFIVQRSLFNVLICFTNIGLFKNSRPFLNLARKVRAVVFQRQQSFNFLDNLFNSIWNFWLVNWWSFVNYRLATSSLKLQQLRFFRNYNVLAGIMYSSHRLWLHYPYCEG